MKSHNCSETLRNRQVSVCISVLSGALSRQRGVYRLKTMLSPPRSPAAFRIVCGLQKCMLSFIFVTRAVLVLPDYGAQRYNYQEGQRQRFLQEQYQRLAIQDAMATEPDVPHSADPEATDEALPEGEMPEYIQEEDEEEDLLYFVQPQQRSHGDIYLASSVGDTNRVR